MTLKTLKIKLLAKISAISGMFFSDNWCYSWTFSRISFSIEMLDGNAKLNLYLLAVDF
jgi:hypothetical protein